MNLSSVTLLSTSARAISGINQLLVLWIIFICWSTAKAANEFIQTDSRHEFALLGDRVEVDCVSNTSSPPNWYFKAYDSNESELISGNNQSEANVTTTYSIVSENYGHVTLIIDRMLLTHAGRYECQDIDKKKKLSMELTVLDPIPDCNQSRDNSSVFCRFFYAGNVTPEFSWSTLENSELCNTSVFNSSTIGSLRAKYYKRTDGHRRCKPKADGGPSANGPFKPLNFAAVKGEGVKLSCSTQVYFSGYWFRIAPLTTDEILIAHEQIAKIELFAVDESVPGRSYLLFTSSDNTSGRYRCDSVDAAAELVVLDPQPTCIQNIKAGVANATCSIDFSGNWPPVIEWNDTRGPLTASESVTIPSNRVYSSLILPLNLDRPGNLYLVTCSIKFKIEHKPPEATETNIPDFPYVCKITIGDSDSRSAEGEISVRKWNKAAFSKPEDEFVRTEYRFKAALLGDTVKLDYIANTSRPPDWYFKAYGSNESELINGIGLSESNDTSTYRILSEKSGQVTLVIDRMIQTLAGRYECHDKDKQYKLSVELTFLEPSSECGQSPENSSIVCRFPYTGNVAPDFAWSTLENSDLCNTSVFDVSTIVSQRIKNYKRTAGLLRCIPNEDDGDSAGKFFTPLNYAAVKGESVRLNCTMMEDDTGYWFRIAPLTTNEILISQKQTIRNVWFSINKSVPGRSDLLFISSDKTSGRYRCDTVKATAEVIGLDPQPRCWKNIKDGVANASCSIGFSGNWAPVIEWTGTRGTVNTTDPITIPSYRVTSSLILSLDSDNPNDLYIVTCSIKFKIEDKPQEATETNIPEFPYTCKLAIHSSEHGDAAGAIEVGQEHTADSRPAADENRAPNRNEGIAEVENPNSGSFRESFVLLQVFMAFVATSIGISQF